METSFLSLQYIEYIKECNKIKFFKNVYSGIVKFGRIVNERQK